MCARAFVGKMETESLHPEGIYFYARPVSTPKVNSKRNFIASKARG